MKHKALLAIVWGGLLAGAFDLIYAITFYGAQGTKPIRIPQSIASGLLGMAAFKGGWNTALLGVALHFIIALVAAAIYYVFSCKVSALVRKPLIFGMLYGVAIYFFMRLVVLPLSAAPHFKSTPISIATDFAVHMFLIGPSIALSLARFRKTERA